MVAVRSTKSVMELISEAVVVLQNAVLNPGILSAISLFVITALAEVPGFLPVVVILIGPVAFLKGSLTLSLVLEILFFVAVPFALGTALGSLLIYALAYWGGKPAINRYSKYLRFNWEDVERMERRFEGKWYDEVIFTTIRAIPFTPTLPLNIAAGLLRMNILSYLCLTVLGMVIRFMIMVLIVGSSV